MEAAEDADLNHEYNSSLEVSLSLSVTKYDVLREINQKADLAAPSHLRLLDRLGVSLSSQHSACLETRVCKQFPWQIPNLVAPRRSIPLAAKGKGFGNI